MKKAILPGVLFALIFFVGCSDNGHDHADDEQDHREKNHALYGDGDDDMNDFSDIVMADDHAGDDGHGHQHGENSTAIVVTHFTDTTELFVEFPALVAGQESPFAAHLTRLDNFKPVANGRVTVTLRGGGVADEVFSVGAPTVPGIFRPVAIPKYPLTRRLSLRLQGEGLDVVHELGAYTVYPSQVVALAETVSQVEPDNAIAYLKEQQWQVDFALAEVTVGELRASVQATGMLRPRANGEVYLSATSAGHLQSKGDFPYPGMKVERDQALATIAPRLGMGGDLATLKAARDKARSEYQLAKREQSRLKRLWKEKAIARHRLYAAESAETVAKAERDATERRYQQSAGRSTQSANGKPFGSQSSAQQSSPGIPILAPINGLLARVEVAPGQYVHEGDALFHIVNVDRLWLESRIAEADVGVLQQPTGAWFTLEGFEGSFNSFDLDGHLVALGGAIDSVTRTVPLIFEFKNPDRRLRTGMFANVRVYTGKIANGATVPTSAVYDDGGQEVVYVMLEGESFQRRIVRLGIRDGDRVQIKSGVEVGERVVSRGAYQVRLASASPAEAGHGHAH
jgi:RND family efflux transporter MFP subunit